MKVRLQDGTILQVPDGLDQDQIAEVVDTYAAAKPQGFMDRLGADIQKRSQMAGEIQQATRAGQQTKLEEILQLAGKGGAGLMGDIAGNAIGSTLSAITPEPIERPIREIAKAAGEKVRESPVGEGIDYLAGQYGQFAQGHPRAARNVEAAANMAMLYPPAKAAPAAGNVAQRGGILALEAGANAKEAGQGLLNMATAPVRNAYDDLIRPVLPNAAEDEGLIARNRARAGQKLSQRLEQDGLSLDEVMSLDGQSIYQRGGENVERLGEAISQMPGKGATLARDYADSALDEQTGRVIDHIGKFVSNKTNYAAELDTVIQSGRAKASPLYDAAFDGNQVMVSKRLNRILDTPAAQTALAKARTKMQNDQSLVGLPDKQLRSVNRDLAAIGKMDEAPDGIAKGLNLRTFDYVKRALDDQILAARKNPELADDARIITNLKRELVSELDRLDRDTTGGKYHEARNASRGYLEDVDAFESGQTFHKMTPDDITSSLKKMSESERELFRMGISKRITDQIDNAADNTNLSRLIVGKKGLRERLEAALGPDEYAQLSAALSEEKTQFLKAQRLRGGSRTSRMQSEKDDLNATGFDTLQDIQRKGILGTVVDKAGQYVAGRYAVGNQGISEELAKVMFETDPNARKGLLDGLFEAENKKAINHQKAAKRR